MKVRGDEIKDGDLIHYHLDLGRPGKVYGSEWLVYAKKTSAGMGWRYKETEPAMFDTSVEARFNTQNWFEVSRLENETNEFGEVTP